MVSIAALQRQDLKQVHTRACQLVMVYVLYLIVKPSHAPAHIRIGDSQAFSERLLQLLRSEVLDLIIRHSLHFDLSSE